MESMQADACFCGESVMSELFLAYTPLMEGNSHTALILQATRLTPADEAQLNLLTLSNNARGERLNSPQKNVKALLPQLQDSVFTLKFLCIFH
jgi:hypothetical protein